MEVVVASKPRQTRRTPISEQEFNADFHQFRDRLSSGGVVLSGEQLDQILSYGRFVHERSSQLNLIGPSDRIRFLSRHVAESLHPRLISLLQAAGSLVDFGSGAGLPGIPLAIAAPSSSVLLVEPRQRRAQFLEAAVQKLGLAGRVAIYQGTAERFLRAGDGESRVGLVTARAVDRLARTWGWSREVLSPGGWFATFKGPDEVEAELLSIEGLLPALHETCPVAGEPRVLLLLQASQH